MNQRAKQEGCGSQSAVSEESPGSVNRAANHFPHFVPLGNDCNTLRPASAEGGHEEEREFWWSEQADNPEFSSHENGVQAGDFVSNDRVHPTSNASSQGIVRATLKVSSHTGEPDLSQLQASRIKKPFSSDPTAAVDQPRPLIFDFFSSKILISPLDYPDFDAWPFHTTKFNKKTAATISFAMDAEKKVPRPRPKFSTKSISCIEKKSQSMFDSLEGCNLISDFGQLFAQQISRQIHKILGTNAGSGYDDGRARRIRKLKPTRKLSGALQATTPATARPTTGNEGLIAKEVGTLSLSKPWFPPKKNKKERKHGLSTPLPKVKSSRRLLQIFSELTPLCRPKANLVLKIVDHPPSIQQGEEFRFPISQPCSQRGGPEGYQNSQKAAIFSIAMEQPSPGTNYQHLSHELRDHQRANMEIPALVAPEFRHFLGGTLLVTKVIYRNENFVLYTCRNPAKEVEYLVKVSQYIPPNCLESKKWARFSQQASHRGLLVPKLSWTESGYPVQAFSSCLGTVSDVFLTNHAPVQPDVLWRVLSDAALALSTLHHHKIAHMDVTPCNLLLTTSGRVRLWNFSHCQETPLQLPAGTPASISVECRYFVPELQPNLPTEELPIALDLAKVDVFCLGLTMLQLCIRPNEAPFHFQILDGLTEADLKALIGSINVSKDFLVLIRRMLSFLPADRPTAADVLSTAKTAGTGRSRFPPRIN